MHNFKVISFLNQLNFLKTQLVEVPIEVTKVMSKPELEVTKEEPIKMVDESDEPSSAKVTTETVSSTTTVFSYKKSAETESSKKLQETVTSPKKSEQPIIDPSKKITETKPTTTKTTITTENRFSPTSSLSSSLLNKEAYVSDSYSPQYRSNISPRHTVVSRRINSDRSNYVTHYGSMNHSNVTFNDSPISLRPAGSQAAASLALK